MKQKKDQPDHSDQQMRSTNEIERSQKRSHRDQNSEKFSTGVADSATVSNIGVADSATVSNIGVADSATVSNIGVADSATVNNIGVADSATPEKTGYIKIYKNLLRRMHLEIDSYSAFELYLYLYEKAFEWIQDDRVQNTINIDLVSIIQACNMPSRVIRDALEYLEKIGWISTEKRAGMSSIYTIYRPKPNIPQKGDHDLLRKDHDLRKEDHLQSEIRADDSLSAIKQVYVELTKNAWTTTDTENYKKLPNSLQTEDIIRYMRAIFERIKKPVGSFAYFVTAIKREIESPKNKNTTISKLRKIIERVKEANIGGKALGTTDFREQVKEIAARDGVPYTPDFLEEAFKAAA